MDLGIKGRAALVTAASRGLGRAVALGLAREGAQVAICARGEERLRRAAEEIAAETGERVRAYPADVSDPGAAAALVETAASDLGALDILVCNAGGPPSGTVADFAPGDYRKAAELNWMSTIELCYAALPHMRRRSWGRIVALTSVSARQPLDGLVLSNTARAGVLGFAKSLSNHLAPHGVTVNAVCPGYTRTERVEELAADFERNGKGTAADFFRRVEASIPAGRLGRPEELAAVVVFLCSEPAAYITGTALQVDGGFIRALF
jgi:3-oxoacyl-[acyl-carrier protein] reductase